MYSHVLLVLQVDKTVGVDTLLFADTVPVVSTCECEHFTLEAGHVTGVLCQLSLTCSTKLLLLFLGSCTNWPC